MESGRGHYILSCKENCEYPGMPCGLKERVGYLPCADEIHNLRVALLTNLRRVIPEASYLDIQTVGPHCCSSHPPSGTTYHTDLVLDNNGVKIPLGFIEEGVFQSE